MSSLIISGKHYQNSWQELDVDRVPSTNLKMTNIMCLKLMIKENYIISV